jgi:hypothetical protein
VRKSFSADLVLSTALSAGDDNEVRRRFVVQLLRFMLSLAGWLWMCAGKCSWFTVFGGVELLEKFDIVMVPAEKFNAHAVFQRDNGCLHRLPDRAFQLAGSSVWEVNNNIQFCAGDKGMVCPDEESVPGEISRNCTIVFLFTDKLRLEPSTKPLVFSANFQKGS